MLALKANKLTNSCFKIVVDAANMSSKTIQYIVIGLCRIFHAFYWQNRESLSLSV